MGSTANTVIYHADPPQQPLDWILLAAAVIASVPFLVANLGIWNYRKRKYFQALSWELILGSSVAGTIWIVSAMVVNQHFRRNDGTVLGYCALWTFWLQLTLGICLWLCILALRLHVIHVLCTTGRRLGSMRIWALYAPLMLTPAIAFSVIATKLQVSHHPCFRVDHIENYDVCVIKHTGWRLSSFLLLPPLYFSIIVILVLRLRKESDYLLRTEYRHTKEYALMAFVLYLLTGTTYWSNRQNNVGGRCFLTFCVCSLVFFHFWVHTWWPLYICLFKPKSDMDKFEEELRRCGALCLDKISEAPTVDANGDEIVHSFTLSNDDAVFEAIAAEREKLIGFKGRKEYLEQRISQLQSQVEAFQRSQKIKLPILSSSRSTHRFPGIEMVPGPSKFTRHLSLDPSGNLQQPITSAIL